MKIAVALFASAALFAQQLPPQDAAKDVLDFLRTAAEALANRDADDFLAHFDPKTPGYAKLSNDVQALLARSEISSTIEIVSARGDSQKQVLELDWLLQIDQDPARRRIVTCTIEKQGRKWKFIALSPVELFAGG